MVWPNKYVLVSTKNVIIGLVILEKARMSWLGIFIGLGINKLQLTRFQNHAIDALLF